MYSQNHHHLYQKNRMNGQWKNFLTLVFDASVKKNTLHSPIGGRADYEGSDSGFNLNEDPGAFVTGCFRLLFYASTIEKIDNVSSEATR